MTINITLTETTYRERKFARQQIIDLLSHEFEHNTREHLQGLTDEALVNRLREVIYEDDQVAEWLREELYERDTDDTWSIEEDK